MALLPIVAIFFLFQIFSLKLSGRSLIKIIIGILYTYVGLVFFLTGVNVGFSSLGSVLGAELASGPMRWILIPCPCFWDGLSSPRSRGLRCLRNRLKR